MGVPAQFPRSPEIKRVLKAIKDAGLPIGFVDIRHDGVTVYPPTKEGQSAYDIWKAQNQS